MRARSRTSAAVFAIVLPLIAGLLLPSIATAQTSQQRATIVAEPNPVPVSGGMGTTRIRWTTGGGAWGQIFLSADGGAEQLFVEGPEGAQDAPWINPASKYEFRLYAGREHRSLLASVAVTAVAPAAAAPAGVLATPMPPASNGAAYLTASPNPVPTVTRLGETTISWNTGDGRPGQVYVYVPRPGATEQLFGIGPHGATAAPWIDPHATYEFRLYAGENRETRLLTLEVTGLVPSARNAPLLAAGVGPGGQPYVVWDTAGETGQVYAERQGQTDLLVAEGSTGTVDLNSEAASAHRLVLYAGSDRARVLTTAALSRPAARSWFSRARLTAIVAALPIVICIIVWLVRGRPAVGAPLIAASGAVAYFLFAATRDLHLPGLGYDEVLFVNAALGGETDSFVYSRVFGVPFMLGNYVGALKAWLHYPLFAWFGVSPETVRLPTILLSVLAIGTAFVLARRLWGAWTAAGVAALIATDPAFVSHARMDWGPAMLSLLLKLAALYFFFRLIEAPRLRFTAALAIAVVLGLFDKTIFIWFVLALAVAALACRGPRVRALLVIYRTQALTAMVVVGAAAFFLLRLVFQDALALLGPLTSGPVLAERVRFVARLIGETLDGRATFHQATAMDLAAPTLIIPVFFVMSLMFAGLAVWRRRTGGPSAETGSGLTGFFAVVAVVIAVQIVLTPQAINPHHAMVLYPFHHLILVAGAVAALGGTVTWARRPRLVMRGAIAAAFAILLISQHRAVIAHASALDERNQFSYAWTPRIYTLSAFVEQAAPQLDLIAIGDWGIYNQLFALGSDRTRAKLHETFRVLDGLNAASTDHLKWLRLCAERGNVAVVIHGPDAQSFPRARTNFLAFAAAHLPPADAVIPIRDPLGDVVFEVHVFRGRPAPAD